MNGISVLFAIVFEISFPKKDVGIIFSAFKKMNKTHGWFFHVGFFKIQLNQLAWLVFFPRFLPTICWDPGSARWVPNFLMSLASPLKVWDGFRWLLMAGNQKSHGANQLGWCENLANRGIFS